MKTYPIKKVLRWALIGSILPLLLYASEGYGNKGFGRLAVALVLFDFAARVLITIITLLAYALNDKKLDALFYNPKRQSAELLAPSVPYRVDLAYDVLMALVMIWHGWAWCAALYVVATIAQSIGMATQRQITEREQHRTGFRDRAVPWAG